MNYTLIKDTIDLVEEFEQENLSEGKFSSNVNGFIAWLVGRQNALAIVEEPDWEGKISGRSAESIIATLIVHMNHYARNYFRAVISGSDFSTPEEVIYLIVLRFNAPLSKMELIKKNVHDKPVGMQIINRLISKGWVLQRDSEKDKRSKVISPTPAGLEALDELMEKVRLATNIVSGKLSTNEKNQLITLFKKLNDFHQSVYEKNFDSVELLQSAVKEMKSN